MSNNVYNFRKHVYDQAPENYKELLDGCYSLIDKDRARITANETYLQNYAAYQHRLNNEVTEYNTSLEKIQDNNKAYQYALSLMESGNESDYLKAAENFENLGEYKDSINQLELCRNRLKEIDLDKKRRAKLEVDEKYYNYALSLMESDTEDGYQKAITEFKKILNYKDSQSQMENCLKQIERIHKENDERAIEEHYNLALSLMNDYKAYNKAALEFEKLGNYKNSASLRKQCLRFAKKENKSGTSSNKKVGVIIGIILLIVGVISISVVIGGGNLFTQNTQTINSLTNSAYGSLNIKTTPSEASIYIDDVYMGKTPLVINNVPVGTHILKLSKTDNGKEYIEHLESITISPDSIVEKDIALSLASGSILNVMITPSGASVYLDGIYKGVAPITLTGIRPGIHTLRASLSGYSDVTYTFEADGGGSSGVSLSLGAFEG